MYDKLCAVYMYIAIHSYLLTSINRLCPFLAFMIYQATVIIHTNRNSTASRIPIMIPVATCGSNPIFVSSAAVVGVLIKLELLLARVLVKVELKFELSPAGVLSFLQQMYSQSCAFSSRCAHQTCNTVIITTTTTSI